MSTITDIALPDAQLRPAGLDTSTNQGKFADLWTKILDIWWRICSVSGLTKTVAAFADGVLSRPIPKLDANWLPTKVPTSGYQEIGALPQNFKNLQDQITSLQNNLDAAVAKAVSDYFTAHPITAAPIDPATVTAIANAAVTQIRTDLLSIQTQAKP